MDSDTGGMEQKDFRAQAILTEPNNVALIGYILTDSPIIWTRK